ncbi:MAG: hypothetical protein GX775_01915, partial [Erysipelothrix sp.]|nr:hypothetical protein [Erysipelothrix sp.]
SLGFRGEALPSIASVSIVKAISSYNHQGYEIQINNGKELLFQPASHGRGTTIEVSSLFFRLPARLKFLKSPQYEATRINALMHSFVLGYPQIAFKISNENRTVLETKGNGKLEEIIFQLYGPEAAATTRVFSRQSANFKIHGVYVLPHIHRANRYHEYFYLNSRMINYFQMNQVINEVFHRYMPGDRYPIVVCHFESDVQLVDVNVHPSKWQVKISQEKELLDLTKETLFASLSEEMTPKIMRPLIERPREKVEIPSIFEMPVQEERVAVPVKSSLRVLAQHHGKYILGEDESGLYLFDQHASMERVQYEFFRKKMSEKQFHQQDILVPIIIKQVPHFDNLIDRLASFGIQVEMISEDELIIRSLPTYLNSVDPVNFINGLFDSLREDKDYSLLDVNEHKLATMACKSSIRFNERRTLFELQKIVDDLLKCENPYHCPHGRPTHVKIDPETLLKEFSR